MDLNETRSKGSIVGLAVGDAIGYPAEFRRRAQILVEIGAEGIQDFIALKDPRFSRPFFTCPNHPPDHVLTKNVLGEGWIGEEAVASAMYCFWRSPDDYSSAVLTAINTDGDSDSIGAITGSVLGARLGINAIPLSWRERVEDSEYLHALGKRLWQKRRSRFH